MKSRSKKSGKKTQETRNPFEAADYASHAESAILFTAKVHYDFNADIDTVWELVANTDRLNRLMGMPAPRFKHHPKAEGGSIRWGENTVLGIFKQKWREFPYEWVTNQYFLVDREYASGPMVRLRLMIRFEQLSERKVRVEATFNAEPRKWFHLPLLRWAIGIRVKGQFLRAFEDTQGVIDVTSKGEAGVLPLGLKRRSVPAKEVTHWTQALTTKAVPQALARKFAELALEGPDAEVLRIRPFGLARAWGVDRMDALRAALRATEAGLLQMTWDVICPGCRGAQDRATHLAELKLGAHCPSCNIQFDAQFDQNVEITFSPASGVRKVEEAIYCVGNPQATPHYFARQRLEPGQTKPFELELPPGRYLMESLQTDVRIPIDVPGSSEAAASVAESVDAVTRFTFGPKTPEGELEPFSLPSSAFKFEVHNDFTHELDWILEKLPENPTLDVCTAAFLTSLQEFRDLFSSEVLRSDQELSISSMTILFTDLKGSTAMYRRIGDAPAFGLVQKHFERLMPTIVANTGGVVKTIGDAIMASFADPQDAIRAGIQLQQEVRRMNEASAGEPLILKVGIHTGPCFVVNSNNRLDYFGTTVNVAARIVDQSQGWDLVITQGALAAPGVKELVENPAFSSEWLERSLKGLSDAFKLLRLVVLPGETEQDGQTSDQKVA